MRRKLLGIFFILNISVLASNGQGINHTWLLGYNFSLTSPKARINFTSTSYTLQSEIRKMAFETTQGNISDINGNLLISSNGIWIANANNDTMLNGTELNPNSFTASWASFGLPIPNGNVILPWPNDSSKYILFHQTANNDANLKSTELYYSVIDMNSDSGLGGVIQKNQIVFQDSLDWGIGVCKHANGRDWWIVALKDSSNTIYKVLLTPNGISSVTTQNLNVPFQFSSVSQPTFSPDGTKFVYSYGYGGSNPMHDVRLFHFDRCTGDFSDTTYIPIYDTSTGFALAFSSDSKYLYTSSFSTIYQINTDTSDIASSLQIVAVNDTFASPFPPFYTDFYLMYLAANGKIYLTSGNSVQSLHFINYPDSSGLACDVHQHDISLSCWHERAVPNHPNYYLGPVIGSICDSIPPIGIYEQNNHDFHFSVTPNPITNGYIKVIYLLPQNKSGVLEVFDVNGRMVFKMPLPPWSTLQQITLPKLSEGIYNAVITSGVHRTSKKIALFSE